MPPDKTIVDHLITLLLAVIGSIMLYIGIVKFGPTETEQQPSTKISRLVSYGLTIRNKSSDLIENGIVEVFLPQAETAVQKRGEIKASHQFSIRTDPVPNDSLVFKVTIPPFATEVITIQVGLEIYDPSRLFNLDDEEGEEFLKAEPYIESDNREIITLAKELKKNSELETSQAIYDWVAGNLKSPGYVRDNRGALYAYQHRSGDCTEYAYLFIALARSVGIPARALGGFILKERSRLRAGEYHNWAEFYLDGAWHLADPMDGNFQKSAHPYVTFRTLRSSDGVVRENSQRFLTFDKRLEVEMD